MTASSSCNGSWITLNWWPSLDLQCLIHPFPCSFPPGWFLHQLCHIGCYFSLCSQIIGPFVFIQCFMGHYLGWLCIWLSSW
jgi:hypothetical protein